MNASEQINQYVGDLADWRGKLLVQLRKLILKAAPEATEGWKWGTPVWSQKGLVCSAAAFKDHVKLNFFQGAALKDPQGLFNSGLEAKATRSIDFSEGDAVDATAVKDLVRAAVAYNLSGGKSQ